MVLTKLSPRNMNNSIINKNFTNLKTNSLDWSSIQTEMRNKLGQDIYESWLKKINFVDEFNNYILLSVPTRFIRDWITSRYLDQILQIIRNYKKDLIRIEFKIIELNTASQKENNYNSIKNNENISFIKDSYNL